MALPPHTTKVGDWVRPCVTDHELPKGRQAYVETEPKRVVEVTAYDIVVQDGIWKFPYRSWVRAEKPISPDGRHEPKQRTR